MTRRIVWRCVGICILIRLYGVRVGGQQAQEIYTQAGDYISVRDKHKLYKMSLELVRDINQRMRQTDGLREEHGNHLLYEIGTLLGQIKEKYKRQVEMYRQAYNWYANVSSFLTPELTAYYKPVNYALILEFIVAKQLEIEQLVEIVMKVPKEDLYVYTPPPQKILIASSFVRQFRTRDPRHPKEPGEFLGGPSQEAVEQDIMRMAQEERLKMKYRADYIKRHKNNAA